MRKFLEQKDKDWPRLDEANKLNDILDKLKILDTETRSKMKTAYIKGRRDEYEKLRDGLIEALDITLEDLNTIVDHREAWTPKEIMEHCFSIQKRIVKALSKARGES